MGSDCQEAREDNSHHYRPCRTEARKERPL